NLEPEEYQNRFPEVDSHWLAGVLTAPESPPGVAGEYWSAETIGSNDPIAPKADARPANPPGYELIEEIGHGGMGVVYRAHDSALDREVAVKLLSARYPPDAPAAQRFLKEARITGQLQHPGIPAVHQVGTLADGRPFL